LKINKILFTHWKIYLDKQRLVSQPSH